MTSDCKFYVFREGRRTASGEHLLGGLRGSLGRAQDENGWVDAVLRAGELECALEDAGDPDAKTLAEITDACAKKLVSWSYRSAPELTTRLPLRLAGEFTVSTPEGFAYYALHPRQYAEVAERLGPVQTAVVVGIRSIGVTLSAMTAAALRRMGASAERFSVRPGGHPFDRQVEWTSAQQRAIAAGQANGALFLIVDEGPGMSGSSFLSVAEGLCRAGVSRSRIVMIPSHEPQLDRLRAHNARERWGRFRTITVPEGRYPEGVWIGNGEWRKRFCGDPAAWPGSWSTMERAKFLGKDVLWKFEGLGPYGVSARKIARALASERFGAPVVEDQYGYLGYQLMRGRAATREDLTPERVRRIAEYCALRAQEFHLDVSVAERKELVAAGRVNYERAFGSPLSAGVEKLPVVRAAICDAKMAPNEWLITHEGRLLKLDATGHGDAHFFPGPCDIAWDLAGAIIEWEMDAATRESFLHTYTSLAHDAIARRIRNYLVAYAVFRFAWTRMAAAAMHGSAEEARLLAESERYRATVEQWVTAASTAPQGVRAS